MTQLMTKWGFSTFDQLAKHEQRLTMQLVPYSTHLDTTFLAG